MDFVFCDVVSLQRSKHGADIHALWWWACCDVGVGIGSYCTYGHRNAIGLTDNITNVATQKVDSYFCPVCLDDSTLPNSLDAAVDKDLSPTDQHLHKIRQARGRHKSVPALHDVTRDWRNLCLFM
jgi:hypothetical protein